MSELYIGLLSGTSMDAIDGVLVDLGATTPILVHSHCHPIPRQLRQELLECMGSTGMVGLSVLGGLNVRWGRLFAEAAVALLEATGTPAMDVQAIGSHGQTMFHDPNGPVPFSLQLGDPNHIAEITGITTVADFRGRDLAAGGQGAPLVPAFHAAIFQNPTEARVVLNLGGIANVTILPADPTQPLRGFDTGPGNLLLDAWCLQCRGEAYDSHGTWGATGTVHTALLASLLKEPYFRQTPPKSTGRELFNPAWLRGILESLSGERPKDADIQATLAELTACTITDAVRNHAKNTTRLLVCGGGVHNQEVLRRLRALLDPCPVESTQQHGFDPDWVEAAAFAWLAKQTLTGKPGNVPTVTGARHSTVLGAIYPS
ncbi:MAG: anhydro-N-acetylmuramic acid kinase [Gammaproteobacteria bacterium]